MERIVDRATLPRKFASHGFDLVPMPFGSGNCQMPCFECTYEGDIEIPDGMVCKENKNCPAYAPVEIRTCPKHGEYDDYCGDCEAEVFEPKQDTLNE